MMPKVQGVVHFTMPVSDLDRSTEFYAGLLGMEKLLQTRHMVFLKCGEDYVILGKTTAKLSLDTNDGNVIHHAFKVAADEFAPMLDLLKRNGIEIAKTEDRRDGIFIGRSAYFRDPDGNRLEIHDAQAIGRV